MLVFPFIIIVTKSLYHFIIFIDPIFIAPIFIDPIFIDPNIYTHP